MCDEIIDEVAIARVCEGHRTKLTEAERFLVLERAIPAWETYIAEQKGPGYGRHYDGTRVHGNKWRDPDWMLLLADGLGVKITSLKRILDRHRERLAKGVAA